jgi:hypothetical protein
MTEADAALVYRLINEQRKTMPLCDPAADIVARVAEHLKAAAVNGVPVGTEARVCTLIARRQQVGIRKYGQTVDQNPLPLRDWLQHALEEALDQAIYLQRAIDEIDSKVRGEQ